MPHDALLRRIRDGDRAAFQALYEDLGPQVLGYLIRRIRDEAIAQEVLQEVFLNIWRRAASFDPERAGAKTWIFTIARNAAIDRLRRVHVRQPSPDDPQWVEAPPPPEQVIDDARRAERVLSALESLPEPQQDVLRRSFFQLQSYAEIAEDLQIALGTVKSRARLGFERLRILLVEDP